MSWLDKGADGSEDHRGGPYGLAQEGENHLRPSGLSRSVTTKSPETSDASRCSTVDLRFRHATIRRAMNVPKREF